ncbi:MAG: DUF1800 domain-containing protein, partial [Armatimonadetes bacterium]|nr:DUF1800 domain-containing protein [Armatimonadota bacterium]
FNGEDVAAVLCANVQTSRFIAKKMCEWFAYVGPDEALVERLAKKFRDSHLEVKTLVRAIMESPEFYSEGCVRRHIKNPIDFTVATIRQLGLGASMLSNIIANNGNEDPKNAARYLAPVAAVSQATKAMGMEILFPPDVSGWKPDAEYWISSATMVERIKWAARLFEVGGGGKGQFGLRFPAIDLFEIGMNHAQAAHALMSVFDVQLPPAKVKQLEEAASLASEGQPITPGNANKVAAFVCKLIFGSPEFQFA